VTPPPPPLGEEAAAGRLAQKRFVGAMVMGIGILIATLCGLCTLSGIFFSIVAGLGAHASPGSLEVVAGGVAVVLIVGGVPTAAGVVLFVIGRRIYREGRGAPVDQSKAFE